jgi:AcrR family transcriptional regulator
VAKGRAAGAPKKSAGELREPLRERVLSAAFSSFMEHGYLGASTLEIATRAKVSKRDIYSVCADKSELLRQAIAERARKMRLPLELPVATDRDALEKTLVAFGLALLNGVCDPTVLALYRFAIAEVDNAPDVARTIDTIGREANRRALARTLSRAQADGLIKAGDAAAMAVDFTALLWGNLLLQLLFRVVDPPSPPALAKRAREASEKFLQLYGTPVPGAR